MYIASAILATILFGLAALFLKIGVDRGLPEISPGDIFSNFFSVIKQLFKNYIWLSGLAINMIGGLFYFVAIARLDISIVKPIITLYVVIAAVLGVLVLGERLSVGETAGIAVSVIGALMLALYGEASTGSAALGRAQYSAMNKILIADIVISMLLVAPLLIKNRPEFFSQEILISIFSGINWGLAAVYFKLFYLEIDASGLFGENTDYLALVTTAALYKFLLTSWSFWLTSILNVVGFGVYQIAFTGGRVAIVAPIVMISTLFAPVAAGGLVFGEALPPLKIGGILTACAGTAILAFARAKSEPGNEGGENAEK